jgi:hypothetical protein
MRPEIWCRREAADEVITSVLTLVEIERAAIRAEGGGMISEADRMRLIGLLTETQVQWTTMEITPEVRQRASRNFSGEGCPSSCCRARVISDNYTSRAR